VGKPDLYLLSSSQPGFHIFDNFQKNLVGGREIGKLVLSDQIFQFTSILSYNNFSQIEERTMPGAPTGHVFVSYSRRDEVVMRRIVKYLREQGIPAWVDNEKLVPGTPVWEYEIEKAIKGASAIVVILSPDAKKSEWVLREITLADQHQKRAFPILAGGKKEDSIPFRLITRQFVDLRSNEKMGLVSLHNALYEYLKELDAHEDEKTRNQMEEDATKKSSASEIDKTRISNTSTQTILWFTLGWIISGAIGGFIYNSFEEVPGEIIAGAIGGIIGGVVTINTLRLAGKVSPQTNLMWMALVWAFGGSLGWFIGWELTEAIGAGIGMMIFVIIGMSGTLGMDYIRAHWKSIALITLAWAIGGGLGWSISRGMIDNLDVDYATSWAIGTAIGWGIGGFVMGWQLFKTKDNS
jgi:hypothetical protein